MKRLFVSALTFFIIAQAGLAESIIPFYKTPITPPAFEWVDEAGQTKSLNDYKGDVIFLNFWATWCTPCAVEMPAFNFLQNRYGAGGLKMLAINVGNESSQTIQRFMQKHRLNALDIHIDDKNQLTQLFGAHTLPTTYIINRKGEIVAGKEGLASWMSADMMSLIETLLKQENPYAKPFSSNRGVQDISNDLQPAVRF